MSACGSERSPPTIVSHEDSTIDEKIFDWDDVVVNSATYRRALNHNASKRRLQDIVLTQQNTGNTQSRPVSDSTSRQITPMLQPTSKISKPLPYETSVVSEPVVAYGLGARQYIPLSSKSDIAAQSSRVLPSRMKSSDSVKKFFRSKLHKRSGRDLNSSASEGSSSPVRTSPRGRRGFENSFHASIDFGSEDGLAAPSLVRAAQAGSVVEVEVLLDQGADVEVVHVQSRRNALAVAAHCGNDDVVRLLLQHGAKINGHDAFFMTPLYLASMRGHHSVVELLLQERALVDEKGPNDETPLRAASDKGHMEVASLLIRYGAKVNARDCKQLTALHAAAKLGDEAIVDLLLSHRAHIEAKDGSFMAPIHHACEGGHDRVLSLLLQKKADIEATGPRSMTPLVCAASTGQVHVVELLLKKKASLKHKSEGEMTALHWASYNGHTEVVDILLQKRASPNLPNKDGRTALHLAVMAGNFAVVDLLTRKGAAIEAQCRSMSRPLHYACHDGSSPEVIQLLLGCNANTEAEDSSGRRPLHLCAARGLTATAASLLARGVDIEARDAAGDRALSLACITGNLDMVRMLLDHGSRLRSKFSKGPSHEDSPLCLAAKHGNTSVVEELLSRGTSVLQKDEREWQPLRYAAFYAHPQVVNLLLKAGAAVSGNPSGGWGFNVTARRIGFANEVAKEEKRKAQVLNLLISAENREESAQDDTGAIPSPSAKLSLSGPTELDDSTSANLITQSLLKVSQPTTSAPTASSEHPKSPPELDTMAKRSPFPRASKEDEVLMRASAKASPSQTTREDVEAPEQRLSSSYPSRAHIANAFGFDPFPSSNFTAVQESDEKEAGLMRQPQSRSMNPEPPATSSVILGPDGLWRYNTAKISQDDGASTKIYELTSGD